MIRYIFFSATAQTAYRYLSLKRERETVRCPICGSVMISIHEFKRIWWSEILRGGIPPPMYMDELEDAEDGIQNDVEIKPSVMDPSLDMEVGICQNKYKTVV